MFPDYWLLAFTFPLEKRQLTVCDLGDIDAVSVNFNDEQTIYQEITRINLNQRIANDISNCWRHVLPSHLHFTLYIEKNIHRQHVDFVVVFSEELAPYIPLMRGTVDVILSPVTHMVRHIINMEAHLTFGWMTGNMMALAAGETFNKYIGNCLYQALKLHFNDILTKTMDFL